MLVPTFIFSRRSSCRLPFKPATRPKSSSFSVIRRRRVSPNQQRPTSTTTRPTSPTTTISPSTPAANSRCEGAPHSFDGCLQFETDTSLDPDQLTAVVTMPSNKMTDTAEIIDNHDGTAQLSPTHPPQGPSSSSTLPRPPASTSCPSSRKENKFRYSLSSC